MDLSDTTSGLRNVERIADAELCFDATVGFPEVVATPSREETFRAFFLRRASNVARM
jgi:hypothetical protein